MKLLISFATYPRDGKTTYSLLEKTVDSLLNQDPLKDIEIECMVVGDDYPMIDELRPIFTNYKTSFFNINQNCALRKEPISKEIKWAQAVQRTKIFILEKALSMDFDYILMSADDEIYLSNKISTSLSYLKDGNYPDFIFSLGYYTAYNQNIVLPSNNSPYPEPENCISSGCMYRLRNKAFIQDIIDFRKRCWFDVELYIHACKHNNENYRKGMEAKIKPEDYQLWRYLAPSFQQKIYTSFLVPKILIHHGPERSLFKYL